MTAKRRASQTRSNPFAAGFAAPPATPPAAAVVPAAVPAGDQVAGEVTERPAVSKYTALFDYDTLDNLDGLVRVARRQLAKQVTKADIIKSLIALAADDGSLRDQVIADVGSREARP